MKELSAVLSEWRHYLHAHPETAFEEVGTAAFVAEKLTEMGIEVTTGIGGTGVVGKLTCGDGKKVVTLRADMDAINVVETGNPPYRSQCEGKMHACGHDGHVTGLLGAAKILSESRDFNGTVQFLFQPAEEPGKGARAMIEDGLFDRFPTDEIYGMHNSPYHPVGTVNTASGGYCSAEDNFTITIHGKGGHASAPEKGIDPLVIAAQVILGLQTIPSRSAGAFEPIVVSCTEILSDGAHNAIPSNVTILGDCRSYNKAAQELIETRMHDIVDGICKAGGATYDFLYTHEFAPTVNHAENVGVICSSAEKVVGAGNINGTDKPMTFSEDFGLYLEYVSGAFFMLGGAVEGQPVYPLHNSNFNYNDNILETGARIFAQIARDRLK